MDRLWRHRAFLRLYGGFVISLLGNALTSAALALLAYQLAGQGASLVFGVALCLRIVARVGAGLFAGGVAERVGVRRSLVAAALLSAGCTAFFYEVGAIWQIYLLVFALNVIDAVFVPVYKAVIPDLVGAKLYPKALAAGTLAYELANIAGPALAALVIAAIGFRGNFLLDAATFTLVAGMAATLPKAVEHRSTDARESPLKRDWKWGAKEMLRRAGLRRSLMLTLQSSLLGAYAFVATVGYVKNELGLSDSDYAWTMAAFGLGSCGAALLYGNLKTAARGRTERFVFPGLAIALLIAVLGPGWSALLVAWAVGGSAYALANVRANELLVDASKPGERPRLFAAQFSLSHVGWGVAYPLAGWLETSVGFHWGAAVFLALLLVARAFAHRR